MPNRNQKKANEALIETNNTNSKLKKSDYLRINVLFVKWKNWLYYLTFVYFIIYLAWQSISRKLSSFCFSLGFHSNNLNGLNEGKNKVILWRALPVLLSLALIRGLVFCADGIVSSWLKSPFGQITYSINKSGIESSRSDEIITVLTEVNEHFKETFKKFGIYAISTDLIKIIAYAVGENKSKEEETKKEKPEGRASEKSGLVVRPSRKGAKGGAKRWGDWGVGLIMNPEDIGLVSLIVPIIYAYWKIASAEKTIKNLEFEND